MSEAVMDEIGAPEEKLRSARARLGEWPEKFTDVRTSLETASDAALAAFTGLRAVQRGHGDIVAVFRALRHSPRALEALYPLAARFPPVSSFFLAAATHEDSDLLTRLAKPAGDDTGIMHDRNDSGSRGGFS